MQELPERKIRQKTKEILGKTGKTRVKMYKFSIFFDSYAPYGLTRVDCSIVPGDA